MKDPCLMCENYSADVECELKPTCPVELQKREIKRLKDKLTLERSYRDEPGVGTIGDVHNMGAW